MVSESSKAALSKQTDKYRSKATVTISDGKILLSSDEIATSNSDEKPFELVLGGSEGAWTIYDTVNQGYFYSKAAKSLNIDASKFSKYKITFDEKGDAKVETGTLGRFLYNVNSPRFLNYTSPTSKAMLLPQLYRKVVSTFDITSAGYATLYTDNAFQMPADVTGYTITESAEAGKINLNATYEAGAEVPAQTALLLKGAEGTYTYPVLSSSATAPTDNLLHGTLVDEETNAGEGTYKYYKLSYDNNLENLGFYFAAADGAAFTNAAGKAYLAIPTTSQASQMQGFAFTDFDTTTGISNVAAPTAAVNAAIYDLNGRRVNSLKNATKGIYLVNGKKVLVK